MKPLCQICLVTKSDFLSGTSQVCRLCIKKDNALIYSAGIAIFLGTVTFFLTNFMFALIPAGIAFILTYHKLRNRAKLTIMQ